MRRSPALFLAIGSVIGALGAFVLARVGLTPAGWSVLAILLGAVLGGCFALMTRSRATTPGAGLLWALAFSFLLWLAGPACMLPRVTSHGRMGMLDAARAHFPELVGYLLVFGAPLGLVLGALSVGKPSPKSRDRKSTRLNSSHLGISYAVFCLKKKNYNYCIIEGNVQIGG